MLFSHLSNMIRIGLFLALILAGATAKYIAAPLAATHLRQGKWYFVTKIVLTYCEKQDRRYSDPEARNG